MQSSFYRRTLPKLIFAIVALTVGVFFSRGDTTVFAQTFSAQTTFSIGSTAPSAATDTTFLLSIPSGDLNFSAVITATPAAAFVAPGPGNPGFVGGTHPALGEVMGELTSTSTLGLANGGCVTTVNPSFQFLNATVDITDTIDPVPQANTDPAGGDGGVLANMWSDDGRSVGDDGTTGPGVDGGFETASAGLTAADRPTNCRRRWTITRPT
jgi:hypothetical protein